MTYTHLSTDELVIIESHFKQKTPVTQIAESIKRSRQTVTNVISYLKDGHSALEFYQRYQENKKRCGRKRVELSKAESTYVKEKVSQGWTPDVIIGRGESSIQCCVRTLYRMFERNVFDIKSLPMQGKRKPNGYQEKRGRQSFRRSLSDRDTDYPNYEDEFGHLEGDTIVGKHHKGAVITLVERLTKVMITLKPDGRTADAIETAMQRWLKHLPNHLFKSITFDCGKEFSNWRSMSNAHDIDIYFADPGTPSQRGLNEHSNGLLRKDGLPKQMDLSQVSQNDVSIVASKRNHIPRKSLKYRTPLEIFMSYIQDEQLSSLI